MKKVIIFAVMLANVLVFGFSQTGNSWTVTNTATWVAAVGGVRSGGNNQTHTITVTGNVAVPSSNESLFGTVTGITVTIQGNGTLSLSNNGTLLYIGEKQTVVAKDITLQGRTNNNASLVTVDKGTFRMEGNAKVTGNTGNGITVNSGTLTMDGGIISNNTGNGVCFEGNYNDGTFTMNNGTISGNTKNGVYFYGKIFTMNDGTISNNGGDNGGGVYSGGILTMRGGTISDNHPSKNGGGVYIGGGTFTMQGGTISGNIVKSTSDYWSGESGGYGGGVYVKSGTFTMEGGTISNNTAYNGGGVSMNNDQYSHVTFIMEGGTISNNTADNNGGGVYGYGSMGGNASVPGNTAKNNGGGVYVGSTSKDTYFVIQDNASVSKNTASRGGGVYIDDGHNYYQRRFTMQGSSTVSGNIATYSGGGVYIDGDGSLIKTGGTIYGDDADMNLKNTVISKLGSAVYETKNGGWRNTTAEPTMNVDSYGFWLNDGDVAAFPAGFTGNYGNGQAKFNLTLTENTIKSSTSNNLWVLTRVSGNAYTFKRSDAANTMTITILFKEGSSGNFEISGDSGANNWNGTWWRQRGY